MAADLLAQVLHAGRQADFAPDATALADACLAAQRTGFEALAPDAQWDVLSAILMSPCPGHALRLLREAGALRRWLPEVDAMFGVPQLCDLPEPVDVGLHQMALLNEMARIEARLSLRFAALMHKVGKGGTPSEIWPSHFKHEVRAHALLGALGHRIALPEGAVQLAHLVIDECDRVHRASDMRAGPIAAMLARLDVQGQPERFEDLLTVCTSDYAAYPGHTPSDYPKADRLRRALAACRQTDVTGLSPDAVLEAHALAIDRVLRGTRATSTL
jgi:tRNA nucleotidyltransferase (CCA-adding enzyme)